MRTDTENSPLTKDNIKYFQSVLHPVEFAKAYCCNSVFMEALRPFQIEILSCPHKRVVMRIGRRSGKTHTLALKAFTAAMTNGYYRVAIITPTQSQCLVIFEMILHRVIEPSDILYASLDGNAKKNPPEIVFKNKSKIRFYTAGTRTGSGAMGIRGQGADLIILDEADYLNGADLESILALTIENKNIAIWASSTPTGKRGHFFQWCHDKYDEQYNKDGWVPFHFKSSDAIPDWNEETEKFMRKNYTGDGYAREVDAEFGHEMAGVFNKYKIEILVEFGKGMYDVGSIEPPTYGYEQRPVAPALRTMGVDWDKYGAPTQIVILEATVDGFKVANRVEIPKSEFTYTHAVNKIIELNRIWDPKWIYVDSGAGEMQIEMLKKHGMDHKETGLHEKVKRITFGGKTDWFDPFTKEIHKKDTKSLMVNLLAKAIEEERIILNEHDDVMYSQLINYCVTKISPNGRPIYTSENDHIVDATMLAYFAIVEQYTDLNKVKNLTYYNFTPRNEVKDEWSTSHAKYRSVNDFALDKVNPRYYDQKNQWTRFTNLKAVIKRGINSLIKRKTVHL